ncbi:HNH endonuclease [Corynebacterium sp. 35RC1]|nr:HNH endonuclease [Corynebacterium sp. 35RC1]
MQRTVNKLQFEAYLQWSEGLEDCDLGALAVTMATRTGETEYTTGMNLFAAHELQKLPNILAFQQQTWVLDLKRLRAIIQAIEGMPEEFYPAFEQEFMKFLEPKSPAQALPSAARFGGLARRIRQDLDPIPFPMRKDSEKVDCHSNEDPNGLDHWEALLSKSRSKVLAKTLGAISKKYNCSKAEAIERLCLDKADVKVHLHLYEPKPTENGRGDLVECEGETYPTGHLGNLLALAEEVVEGEPLPARSSYEFSDRQKERIKGRDGVCRFPGCSRRATRVDIDHVVPFSQGGPTHESNAQCLCRTHHIMKTRRIVSCEIMPDTYAVKWILPDGTIVFTHPEGPLAPELRNSIYTLRDLKAKFVERDQELREAAKRQAAREAAEYAEYAERLAEMEKEPIPF